MTQRTQNISCLFPPTRIDQTTHKLKSYMRGPSMRQSCWFLLSLFLFCPSYSLARDWPTWRGPEQNGVSRETDLPASFKDDPKAKNNNLVWKAPYGTRSTPIVMNGRVYFINQFGEKINEQERVMCVDEKTGKKIWERRFNVFHTDIVSVRLGWGNLAGDPKTGNIYWHGTQGLFVCFNKDGKILWSKSMTEEFGRVSGYGGRVNSPTVDGDLVILGMPCFSWGEHANGAVRYVGMNKHTGKIVWWWTSPYKVRDSYYSNPVVAVINGQRLLITGAGDGYAHALKVRSGEHVWSLPVADGGINCSPVVQGNYVYIGHGSENLGRVGRRGAVFCIDASKVSDKKPKVVWKEVGVEVRYTSPIIKDDRLYISTNLASLECFDAKTGKRVWRRGLIYGRNAKGSPVWADGKIYVGAVDAEFSIIDPSKPGGKVIHTEYFPSPDGETAVEINGTAAVANGRVFFGTSEALYCIGKKKWDGKEGKLPPMPKEQPITAAKSIRIEPAEITAHPGEKVQFVIRRLDANGRVLQAKKISGTWSLPTPETPPKLKAKLPPLKGTIEDGLLTLPDTNESQGGLVGFKCDLGMATARVRVIRKMPLFEDFEKETIGLTPRGWINAQGKNFVVKLKDGNKVLRNNNRVASPLVFRSELYFGEPTWMNYTIEAETMGTKVGETLPDMGVINSRYRLVLMGDLQRLRIDSWDPMPRIAVAVPFKIEPGQWYKLKFRVQVRENKALVQGKAWVKGKAEPKTWNVQVNDPNPCYNGCAGLYRYGAGVLDNRPGTDIYFDNVKVTPNRQ